MTVYEVDEIPVLNPEMLNDKDTADAEKYYQKLFNREIEDIHKEISKRDRMGLDEILIKRLGLDSSYLPRIYEGLSEIVKERLDLPKMRKKQQKESVNIAVEQIKQMK